MQMRFTTKLQLAFLSIAMAETHCFGPHSTHLSSATTRNHHASERNDQCGISYPMQRINDEISRLYLQQPSTQDSTPSSSEKEGSLKASGEEEVQPPDLMDTVRFVVRQTGLVAVNGFSIFMNIIGLYFTLGLVLNICGYAYEFSFKEGYKIDTIKNKRIERQFERESRRYEKEHNQRLSQLTVGASSNSETVEKLLGDSK